MKRFTTLSTLVGVLLVTVAISAQGRGGGGPQVPTPKNLQFFPKEFTGQQILPIMQNFNAALGVNCTYCHNSEPPVDNPKNDFASDEKETKKKARVMMKMVAAINGDYLTKLGEGEEPPTVMCETCHHGQKEPPEPLAVKLTSTAGSKGVDAAFDQYADLKTKYAEAGVYDFREQTLLRVARALNDNKKPEDSLAALKKTKALFPQSADVAAALRMALAQSGDVAGGKAELERALSIDPNNGGAKFGLDRLNHPPAPAPAPPK